ncbi:PstS family phosphate ABC transporter substrate-binding protein [Domibacillus aminovorans]|uniref:Phosphate-binding protein n=1 Tax=Domibacillus aminovorans TaxID=29332 RepID=A0A177L5F2_9BACI|nr:PstS family phosphate ABC transporter substrate-binding protein [Domibacillus aminovorans]OAH60908.1 phosphate-binding protein [Domibacillus aminovorans]
MKMKSVLFPLIISTALLLGACGTENGRTVSGNAESSTGLSGSVRIDGSSTVFPIMEAVSEDYTMVQPEVDAPVFVSGTGGGFEKFINGETDISNASRPLTEEEIQRLEENQIEYTEFEIAYDGLSVVVNKENDFVDQLTVDQLQKLWLDSEDVQTWADVREGWPEESIAFYSPGSDSGTYDYFDEAVLEKKKIRGDATMSEDDNVLVEGVMSDKNAIGYFGFAYYVKNKDNLKVVPVVNGKGKAVTPNHETIMTGEYEPLSRPMYFYVRNDSLQENPQVYDYVEFALTNMGTLSEEVGYVSLKKEEYEEALTKLKEFVK